MTSPIHTHTHTHNTFVKNNNNITINALLSANRDGDVDGRRRCSGCFKVSCHFFKTKRGAAGVDSDDDQVRDFAARIPYKHTQQSSNSQR